MKTKELINLASRFGYKTVRSLDAMNFVKNKIDYLHWVELTGPHYMVSDSMPAQLAHAIIDYANTPVEERRDEKRWNIVIGQDTVGSDVVYAIWYKDEYNDRKEYHTSDHVLADLFNEPDAIFSDSELDDLLNYLKSLPDGETYAKIAELGKREVK